VRLEDKKHREEVREQILVKMRRRLKNLHEEARARYEAAAGEAPEVTLQRLAHEQPAKVAAWMKQRPGLGKILDWNPEGNGPLFIPISHHPDQVVSVTRGYGKG